MPHLFIRGGIRLFCPNCGNRIPDATRFCPYCGVSIENHYMSLPTASNKKTDNLHGIKKPLLVILASLLFISVVIALMKPVFTARKEANEQSDITFAYINSEGGLALDPFFLIEDITLIDKGAYYSLNDTTSLKPISVGDYRISPYGEDTGTLLSDYMYCSVYKFGTYVGSYYFSFPGLNDDERKLNVPISELEISIQNPDKSLEQAGVKFSKTKAVYKVKQLVYLSGPDEFDRRAWKHLKRKFELLQVPLEKASSMYLSVRKEKNKYPQNELRIYLKNENGKYQSFYIQDLTAFRGHVYNIGGYLIDETTYDSEEEYNESLNLNSKNDEDFFVYDLSSYLK